MSDWNEEQAKAKDKRRGVTDQRGNIHAKKKKPEPGRYKLMQRVDPQSSLAKMLKANPWVNWRSMSWADLEEAKRIGSIFARKNAYYEYHLHDIQDDIVYPLKGQ